MISVNELMLGDYITLAESLKDGGKLLIFKIIALNNNNDALVLLKGEEACDEVEIDNEWCGIPITPEILEKNGFVKDKVHSTALSNVWVWCERTGNPYASTVEITLYPQPICGVSILTKIDTKSKTGCGCDSVHSCDIDSVHELQHALHLCRINKEITL